MHEICFINYFVNIIFNHDWKRKIACYDVWLNHISSFSSFLNACSEIFLITYMCGCVKPSTVMMDKIVQIFYKQKLIYMLIKIKKYEEF